MLNTPEKKKLEEKTFELVSPSKKNVFNQTYSIRNSTLSKEIKEKNKIFRRYSIDDNGGGYTGL